MKEMQISLNLAKLWLHFIAEGKTVNVFNVGYDDPNDLWVKGDLVKVGLQLDGAGRPEFYAENLTQDCLLSVTPEKLEIGKGFRKCFFPHRLLRANMPKKRALGRQEEPSSDIAKCNYYCQDPYHRYSLLVREPFCIMTLPTGRIWALYYNFAPFEEEGHLLWMPAKFSGTALVLPHFPQVITKDFLEDVMVLFQGSRGFFYLFNSIHAGATQHHFHYQLIYAGEEDWPIEKANISTNEGYNFLDGYPIEGLIFNCTDELDRIWHCIDCFQQNAIPFNMIMVRDKIFLIPKNPDHEIVEEFPFGVLASAEMAGRLILSDRKNFDETTYEKVKSAFKKSGLEKDKIIRLINSNS